MKSKFYIGLISYILLLPACGGGGGGGASSGSSAAADAPRQNESVVIDDTLNDQGEVVVPEEDSSGEELPVYEATSEVVVPNDFNLNQVTELEVVSMSDSEGYLSVCSKFSENTNETYRIDFSSCLLRQRIDGQLQKTISVSPDMAQLISVVHYFDGSAPRYGVWYRGQGSARLEVN